MIKLNRKIIIAHCIIISTFIIYMASANFLFDKIITVKNENTLQKCILPKSKTNIKYGVDVVELTKVNWKELVRIRGWAFVNGVDAEPNELFIVLTSEDNKYVFNTSLHLRYDIPDSLAIHNLNLERAGFNAYISKETIRDGRYNVGFYIKNNGQEYFTNSNVYITKTGNTVFQGFISDSLRVSLPEESTDIEDAIDIIKNVSVGNRNVTQVSGWAFIKRQNSSNSKIFVVLKSKEQDYTFDTVTIKRPDITNAYGKVNNLNLDDSGFVAAIPSNLLESSEYKIGIIVKSNTKQLYRSTEKVLTVDLNPPDQQEEQTYNVGE